MKLARPAAWATAAIGPLAPAAATTATRVSNRARTEHGQGRAHGHQGHGDYPRGRRARGGRGQPEDQQSAVGARWWPWRT